MGVGRALMGVEMEVKEGREVCKEKAGYMAVEVLGQKGCLGKGL